MAKNSIKTKILKIILTLSIISLLLLGVIALYDMFQLGSYALKTNQNLGKQASDDSSTALQDQAKYYLVRMAESQAHIANAIFEKVETSVNIASIKAQRLWEHPEYSPVLKSYSPTDNLKNPKEASVYKIAPNTDPEKIKKDIEISSGLDFVFKEICKNDANIKSIYMGTQNGLHRRYPWTSKHKTNYDPRIRSWYKKAVTENQKGWTDLYISASDEILMVTCYKPVYMQENKLIGVVGADVTLDALNKEIINKQIGDLGYAFLLDKNGKVIANKNMSKGDLRWDEELETQNMLQSSNKELSEIAYKMTQGQSGIGPCTMEDEEKFIAYAPIESTGWSIGIVMPVKEIIEPAVNTCQKITALTKKAEEHIDIEARETIITLIAIFIAILIIVTLTSIKLAKSITKPILQLDQGAKILGEGNLDYKLDIKTGDELEELSDTFNKMTNDLKTYIEDLRKTTAEKEKIESELKIAQDIQTSFLPSIFPPFPMKKEFDIFAIMHPAKEVGGDFYDFVLVDDTHLFFVIGDVSGKGVPAALFMVIMKVLLKTEALRKTSPQEILEKVNNIIAMDNDSCMFATIFCGILNTSTGEIHYANAGHNPPLVYNKTADTFDYLTINKGFVLGPMPDMVFKNETLQLKEDDILFMYTDGVNEAMNKDRVQFSEPRLKQDLENCEKENVTDMIHCIRKKIADFVQDAEQSDDITMLALKYKG